MNIELLIAFDLRWRVASDRMRERLASLTNDLLEYERQHAPRGRARRYADAIKMLTSIEALHCNVAAIDLAAPGGCLAVRREHSASQVSSIFGAHFNKALDLAEGAGLIEQERGWRYARETRKLSHVRALISFSDYLPTSLTFDDLMLIEAPVIELRAADGSTLPIDETEQMRRWRNDIERINAVIGDGNVSLDGQQAWTEQKRDGMLQRVVTTQHTALCRVFNGDWNHGGRLFGGWWQNMSKADRLGRIRINGEAVAEVDWSQLFPRLAYRQFGVPWPFSGDDDCYIAGAGERRGWKALTNALLMASKPLNQWPGRSPDERQTHRDYFPAGTKPSTVYAAIRERHYPILAALECGLAGRLQRLEADMLIASLLTLAEQGITALPEHDSVIVPVSQAHKAQGAMHQAAVALTGSELPVTVKYA